MQIKDRGNNSAGLLHYGNTSGELMYHIRQIEIVKNIYPVDLPKKICKRAEEIVVENASNPFFYNSQKVGVEAVNIENGRAVIYITERDYAQVCASRECEIKEPNPLSDMYTLYGDSRRSMLFVKSNKNQVNPYTQGVFVAAKPEGSINGADDLEVLITKRSDNVDHARGMFHFLAGYAEINKSFPKFNTINFNPQLSILSEIKDESGISPHELLDVAPVGISQDHYELETVYIALANLTKRNILARMADSKEGWEVDQAFFIKLKDLNSYDPSKFNSHSRPFVREHLGLLVQQFELMLGSEGLAKVYPNYKRNITNG